MYPILRVLKRIRFFNFIRRVSNATSVFNKKYIQILRWGFNSNEYTNYTYPLTKRNIEYLTHTVSVVTGKEYAEVHRYIQEAMHDQKLISHIQQTTAASPFAKFADLNVFFGRRLGWYAFVRVLKPQVIIETGIDKGMGAVLLCAALLKNKEEGFPGEYYGTDINTEAGYLLSHEYRAVGTILYGDSITSLKAFSKKIDLFINDSDHSAEYEYEEYRTIKEKLSENAVLLGDNAHCTDMLSRFSLEENRKFLFFKEEPDNHWYPGAGLGISYL